MKPGFKRRRIFEAIFTIMVLLPALCINASPAQAEQDADQRQKAVDAWPFKEFLEGSKAGFMFRTVYFNRTSDGDNNAAGKFDQEALGSGGWLYGNTGEIGDVLSFGGTYNFTLPVYAPEEKPFNYILRDPGQDAVSVLGEAYVKLRFGSHDMVIGRQTINNTWYMEDVARFYNKLDQSVIGSRDVRGMQMIQFEAVTLKGRLAKDSLRYYGGFIKRARQINDNDFRNLYKAAYQITVWPEEEKTGDSDGALYGGIQFKPGKDMMIEGSYAGIKDMLNTAAADIDYVWRLTGKKYVRLGFQCMYQSGNGDNLITSGRDFHTRFGGIYLETRLIPWLVQYGMAGVNSSGDESRAPYTVGPCYMWQRINENAKAGEHAWILGALFDFTTLGVPGLQFDINYGRRSNRHQWSASTVDGVTAHTYSKINDWDELATDLAYAFSKDSCLRNMRVRLRYARVWEEGGALDGTKITDEYRTYITWNIPIT